IGSSDARKPPCGGSVVHGVDPVVGLPMGRVDCQSTIARSAGFSRSEEQSTNSRLYGNGLRRL
ncbi:hypothetical protein, partial [Enterobacter hormaechei]|uniref:hypothetical protein n=1 Tax=Enterobacter hormaechei TaxID=158836 RepID=UPI00203AB839